MQSVPALNSDQGPRLYHAETDETAEDAAARLEAWSKACSDTYHFLYASWFINIAFCSGIQWITYDRLREDVYAVDQPGQLRLTIDRMMPYVEDRIAKYSASKPKIQAIPAPSTDPTIIPINRDAARHTEYLIEWLDRKLDLVNQDQDLSWWMITTGLGIQYHGWNPATGPTFEQPLTEKVDRPIPDMPGEFENVEQPMIDAKGRPQVASWQEGEIESRNVSPFRLLVDRDVRHLREAPRICELTPTTLEEITADFGEDVASDLGEAQDYERYVMWERRLLSLATPNVPYFQYASDHHAKTFLRKDFYEKPSKRWPKGLHITTINGQIVYPLGDDDSKKKDKEPDTLPLDSDGELLYPNDFYPYLILRDVLAPYRFHPDSVVSHMIPAQKLYNAIRSIAVEHMKRFKGKYVAEEQSITDPDCFSEDVGVIYYDSMGGTVHAPNIIAPAAMPPYYSEITAKAELELEDISGRHDISQGQASGIRSGRMGVFMAEKDDTRLGPKFTRWEAFYADRATRFTKLAKANYAEPRDIVVETDKHGQFNPRVLQILGAEILDNLMIVPGSAIPRSREAKEQIAHESWKDGLYGPPESPEARIMYMKESGQGSINAQFGPYWAAVEKAEDENAIMARGQPVPVKPWELHAYELTIHRNFCMTKEYRELPPEIQTIFDEHLMLTQMAMMPPPTAGPAGPPGPGKPKLPGPNHGEEPGSGASAPTEPTQPPPPGEVQSMMAPLGP